MADNLKQLTTNVDTVIPINGGIASVKTVNHNPFEKEIIAKVGKHTGFPYLAGRTNVDNDIPTGTMFWLGTPMNETANFDIILSKTTLDGNNIERVLELIGEGSIIHFKDFVGRSVTLEFVEYTMGETTVGQVYAIITVKGFPENSDYAYQVGEFETCTFEFVANSKGEASFTTQEITTGGNYNNLEITADLLVFTNENAQAILNGVWGRKEFHILNLSDTYEIKINHNSGSVSGDGLPIKLPTNQGTAGIKGTARILYTEGYGYFVADTWGSTYRPEFKNLPSEQVVTVDEQSNASTREILELIVFRDAQATSMSKSDLNTAYPTALRGFHVVCKLIDLIYIKTDNNTNDWHSIGLIDVV